MSARQSAPVMTSGRITAANLTASVGSAQHRVDDDFQPSAVADLVIALLTRSGVLARVDDVLTAHRWSADLVAAFPQDGTAHLTRARTQGALHLFDAALASLDQAEAYAAPVRELTEERATILQGAGRKDEALRLWTTASRTSRDSHVLGRLACAQAELGDLDTAQELFDEAVATCTGISPVPLAGLYCDWAHLREHARAWAQAEASYRRAIGILPGHARAQLGTAECEARSGRPSAAIARLRPVCATSDDPVYAATLGLLLRSQGADNDADELMDWAQSRFAQLLAVYPEAFASHATKFRQPQEPPDPGSR